MGRRGPKPTPTDILAARGSWRADARGQEPKPDRVSDPEPPTQLNPEAREIWDQVVPLLNKMGVLTTVDVFQLERYVLTYVRWRACAATIEREGEVVAVYDNTGAVDPAETTPVSETGIAPKLAKSLAAARIQTAADLEIAMAAGPLTCYAGIGPASDRAIRDTLVAWRSLNPVRRPVKYLQQRPEVGIANKLDATLRRFEANFGMSPADRVGLQISDEKLTAMVKKNGSRLDQLLSGGGNN